MPVKLFSLVAPEGLGVIQRVRLGDVLQIRHRSNLTSRDKQSKASFSARMS